MSLTTLPISVAPEQEQQTLTKTQFQKLQIRLTKMAACPDLSGVGLMRLLGFVN
jgi:hypothetical protein